LKFDARETYTFRFSAVSYVKGILLGAVAPFVVTIAAFGLKSARAFFKTLLRYIIALVLITLKPTELLTSKITVQGDSLNAVLYANILSTVFLMSILLTVIGTWIGSRNISWAPIKLFFYKWPRNFSVSFVVKALVAQAIAQLVLFRLHTYQDSRAVQKA